VKRFVCEGAKLEVNTLVDREPVELAAEGGDVVGPFGGGEDQTNEGILDQLKTVKRGLWESNKQRVAIVKLGGYQGIGKKDGGF
jgi:hypothetical protein